MLELKKAFAAVMLGLLLVGCGGEETEPEPEPEPIGQNTPPPATKTPEEMSEGAVMDMYAALATDDYAAFRATLWPAQIEANGDAAVDDWFASGSSWATEVDTFEIVEVTEGAGAPYSDVADPDAETFRRVRFVASNAGGEAESSFQVVQVRDDYYVEWVEWEVPDDMGGGDDWGDDMGGDDMGGDDMGGDDMGGDDWDDGQ